MLEEFSPTSLCLILLIFPNVTVFVLGSVEDSDGCSSRGVENLIGSSGNKGSLWLWLAVAMSSLKLVFLIIKYKKGEGKTSNYLDLCEDFDICRNSNK